VALLWSYEAKVEPAQRCEKNFTSERRWAGRIFTVSRRSPLAEELMRESFCEGGLKTENLHSHSKAQTNTADFSPCADAKESENAFFFFDVRPGAKTSGV